MTIFLPVKHKFLSVLALLACALPLSAQTDRLLGGDISLLPTYEQRGTQYRTAKGKAKPLLTLAKKEKWNAARVRLFVHPEYASDDHKDEGVCQDLDYIAPLCRRIKKAGMNLMLDFHYSDTWADPGKQFIPKAWAACTPAQMADSVYAHTRHALRHLKAHGATPDLIQVGNEITFGMLWPTAKTDPCDDANWDTLATMLKSGVRACREECPEARIIIHTEHAADWQATKGYYDRLARYGVDYDIIGLSYYPMWHSDIPNLSRTLDSLETRYPDKGIMIVETAFYYSRENDHWAKSPDEFSDLYPLTPEGQALFTRELVDMLSRHPRVTGLYWWFPEENESGQKVIGSWINRGLFDNHTGCALPAMEEFAKFRKK